MAQNHTSGNQTGGSDNMTAGGGNMTLQEENERNQQYTSQKPIGRRLSAKLVKQQATFIHTNFKEKRMPGGFRCLLQRIDFIRAVIVVLNT